MKNNNAFSITKLSLHNFRSYSDYVLETDNRPVIITGPNGIGKTNILEAISFLSPGKGLRSASLAEIERIKTNSDTSLPWAVSAYISYNDEDYQISTGRDPYSTSGKRVVKIDGNLLKNFSELACHFSVMWLTPQMDGIFISPSSNRRKFLDRLVYNFDTEHASRVYIYEHAMRERMRILQENGDTLWLDTMESRMAEMAVAIAIARLDTVNYIQDSILKAPTPFPKALIKVAGVVEEMISPNFPALEVENILKTKLKSSRVEDKRLGRTNIGTHRSDFEVVHFDKNTPAKLCSTGEQKALLLTIIMAEARMKAIWKSKIPVLLLDEVVAHLDQARRHFLFDELLAMGAQMWLTGTDMLLFKGVANHSTVIDFSGLVLEQVN